MSHEPIALDVIDGWAKSDAADVVAQERLEHWFYNAQLPPEPSAADLNNWIDERLATPEEWRRYYRAFCDAIRRGIKVISEGYKPRKHNHDGLMADAINAVKR